VLIDAAAEPIGNLALAVGGALALIWLLAWQIGPVADGIRDYLLFGLFVAGVLYLFVALGVAGRRMKPVEEPGRAGRAAPPVLAPDLGRVVAAPLPVPDRRRLEAECWIALGDDRMIAGDPRLGEAAYRLACGQYKALADRLGEGEALRRLGHAARRAGDLDRSRQLLDDARARFHQVDDPYGEAAVLMDLGAVHREGGDRSAARAALGDAQVLFRAVLHDLGKGQSVVDREANAA
jgi:hypothetical protein